MAEITEVADPPEDNCPKCKAPIQTGYGLAGGGIGVYFYCETEGCDFFHKIQDEEEE